MRLLMELGAPQEIIDFVCLLAIIGIGVTMFLYYKKIGNYREE